MGKMDKSGSRKNSQKRRGRRRKEYSAAKQRERLIRYRNIGIVFLVLLMLVLLVMKLSGTGLFGTGKYREKADEDIAAERPELDVELLTINPYSRPGTEVNQIRGIVIHYTANPGASAIANRDYFENLKDTHTTQASSHFIVGLEGEIVQCIPTWEVAYASNDRNDDTISIECCHPDETGKFNEETYQSLVRLTTWLCEKFSLTEQDVIRHYDVTGKNCPKYFVENEDAWIHFREDVKTAMENDEKTE